MQILNCSLSLLNSHRRSCKFLCLSHWRGPRLRNFLIQNIVHRRRLDYLSRRLNCLHSTLWLNLALNLLNCRWRLSSRSLNNWGRSFYLMSWNLRRCLHFTWTSWRLYNLLYLFICFCWIKYWWLRLRKIRLLSCIWILYIWQSWFYWR